jgi:hypothetical protein
MFPPINPKNIHPFLFFFFSFFRPFQNISQPKQGNETRPKEPVFREANHHRKRSAKNRPKSYAGLTCTSFVSCVTVFLCNLLWRVCSSFWLVFLRYDIEVSGGRSPERRSKGRAPEHRSMGGALERRSKVAAPERRSKGGALECGSKFLRRSPRAWVGSF